MTNITYLKIKQTNKRQTFRLRGNLAVRYALFFFSYTMYIPLVIRVTKCWQDLFVTVVKFYKLTELIENNRVSIVYLYFSSH